MFVFSEIQIVHLPHSLIVKAKEFARNVVSTTNYTDSNQYSVAKITDDHMISKLGEEAVKIVYSSIANVVGPDYKIYAGKYKSWDHDLYVDNIGLAVKTQKKTTANKFGLSWTFQAGTYRRDTILSTPEAWVCFVEYDDTSATNTCYVYPAMQIKKIKFKEPVLLKLRGHKKVVYADDMER